VFGERGEVLDGRESCAVIVADRFARPGERAAYRAWLGRTQRGLRKSVLDAMNAVSFGNALIGAATAAYERDDWAPWLPAEEPPAHAPSARDRFVASVAAKWAAARPDENAPKPDESPQIHGKP
jgi:hypothetical protein